MNAAGIRGDGSYIVDTQYPARYPAYRAARITPGCAIFGKPGGGILLTRAHQQLPCTDRPAPLYSLAAAGGRRRNKGNCSFFSFCHHPDFRKNVMGGAEGG
jgi:hypothetical protein